MVCIDPVDRECPFLDQIIPDSPNDPYDMVHVIEAIVDDGHMFEVPLFSLLFKLVHKLAADLEIWPLSLRLIWAVYVMSVSHFVCTAIMLHNPLNQATPPTHTHHHHHYHYHHH